MRLLIISDIHANLTAFEHVLADAEGEWDKIWCLGDLIGYGPDPNECVALLRQHDHISLSGNHDWAVLGKLDANTFNHEARQAIDWTRAALTEETRDYLDALPTMRVDGAFTLAHASPRQPVWEYILDAHTAAINASGAVPGDKPGARLVVAKQLGPVLSSVIGYWRSQTLRI
jgi:hypothetical protein